MLFSALLGALLIWFLTMRYRVGFIHAALVFLSAHSIGVFANDVDKGTTHVALIMLLGLSALLLGLQLAAWRWRRARDDYRYTFSKKLPTDLAVLWSVLAVVGFFVIYHYAVGGAPIFSSDLLSLRFDQTRSGLLGLPGRINEYGTYFVVFLVAAYRQVIQDGYRIARAPFIFSLLLLVTSLVLWGNKGNLIQFAVAVAIVGCYEAEKPRVKWGVITKRIRRGMPLAWMVAVALGAVLGFAIMARQFLSLRPDLGQDVLSYFVNRAFYISGIPFYTVVTSFVPDFGLGYGSHLLGDIQYFLSKLGLASEDQVLATWFVSGLIHGRDVYGDQRLAPVTVNIFGYLYMEAGILGVVLGALILGGLSGWLYFVTAKVNRPLRRAMFLFLQMAMFWVLSKGNIGAYLPNIIVMTLLLYLLVRCVALTLELPMRSRSNFTRKRLKSIVFQGRTKMYRAPVRPGSNRDSTPSRP